MQPTLYIFRYGDTGGLTITTDEQGSRLPIDAALGYKREDWKFVAAIPSDELPKMITDVRDAERSLAGWGHYTIRPRQVIEGHPFFDKHPA
jgi:hypothetical protein